MQGGACRRRLRSLTLAGALLALDQAGGTIHTDNEVARHLRGTL